VLDTLEKTVGNTPLVRLLRIPGSGNVASGNSIAGKIEGNNPAGSVKDRPALSMIARAEARGEISPGDVLIEATSGASQRKRYRLMTAAASATLACSDRQRLSVRAKAVSRRVTAPRGKWIMTITNESSERG